MDPSVMNSMMDMMKNPQLMEHMNEMMKNPNIQNMMNNPDLINGMMKMFGDNLPAGMNLNEQTTSDQNQPVEELDQISEGEAKQKFNIEDIVILSNLKNESFNSRRGIIVNYNSEKKRYIVQLDNLDDTKEQDKDKRIMVKEENLEADNAVNIEDENDSEEIINVD